MVTKRLMNTCKLFTLVGLAASVLSCEALPSPPGLKIVPISSFDMMAGEWEGLSKTVPDMRDHARVLLTARAQGRFSLLTDRGADLLLGTGTLTILDGRAFAKSRHGPGIFTLHEKAGALVLVGEVALNDGHHYYLEMTRVR